jgi:predicted double-glycine peptidase
MVFLYFGLRVSEKKLIEEMKTNPKIGTTHGKLIEAVTKRGLYCYVNEHSILQEIEFLLHCKAPVIIHYIEPSEDIGHYSVVKEMTPTDLILHDPWNGKNFEITHDDFVVRWKGEKDNYSFKWLMAVSRDPFPLGKQYKPK